MLYLFASYLKIYASIIGLLFSLENRLLMPGAERDDRYKRPTEYKCEDIFMTMADGTKIHGVWCAPPGWEPKKGALLFCHGNGGNVSYRYGSMYYWVKTFGIGVLLFDYPGYGKSGGTATEATCYASADTAYDWLIKDRKIPAERILIYGGSLGGGVATDLASRRPHRALLLVSTFTSFPELAQHIIWFFPTRWFVRNHFDSLAKIKACKQPTLVVHSRADLLIPFDMGKRLYEASPAPKLMCVMEKEPHHDAGSGKGFVEFMKWLEARERGE